MSGLAAGLQTLYGSLTQPSADCAKWEGLKQENPLKTAFSWAVKMTEWRASVSPGVSGATTFRVQWNHSHELLEEVHPYLQTPLPGIHLPQGREASQAPRCIALLSLWPCSQIRPGSNPGWTASTSATSGKVLSSSVEWAEPAAYDRFEGSGT